MIRPPHPRHLFAILACVALLPFNAAMAYQTADLAGPWRFHALASGPGQPWWERVTATIASGGAASGYSITSAGDSSSIAATIAVGSTGLVTLAGLPQFRGALDVDHTVMPGTDLWSGFAAGTTELRVGVKTAAPYALADIAGTWELQSVASGPGAPWWLRGRVTVATNGGFSGNFAESDGSSSPTSGTLGLASDGTVTLVGAPVARGALDGGRSVFAMTNTWSGFGAGTTELTLALKMAATYAASDLAGTWEASILGTGPGAPWWSRGTIAIAANGTCTGTLTDNSGATESVSGTLSVSATGVVTRSGAPNARGALDQGHSVMVVTDTWATGSPGTTEMFVAVRTGWPGPTDVPSAAPLALALEPVSPNPTRGATPVIRFALASSAPAQLELLDIAGRSVTSREVGAMGAGRHTIALGPTTGMRSGLYWVRLRQGSEVRVTRVVVLENAP